jgi:arylsulfatase A-like enzyme
MNIYFRVLRSAFLAAHLLLLAAAPLAASQPAVAARKTNLIVIMTDNQSASLLGAYGNRQVRTPNIDRLARKGLLFNRAYAGSGVCSPARAILMTGLMPSQNGVHNALPGGAIVADYSAIAEFRNLPQTLADAGYTNALIGKYHLGDDKKPQLGFSYWVTFHGGHTGDFHDEEINDNGVSFNIKASGEHMTDFWTRRAEDFLKTQQGANKPFFLWLSYNGPYILPPTVNAPPNNRYADYYTQHPPTPIYGPVHAYMRDAAKTVRSPANPPVVGGTYPWAGIDALNNPRAMINIASEMTLLDEGIGKVLATLDRLGMTKDTLIVFLSDQGSSYGQNGLWGNSSIGEPSPGYNANMQIPLIFRQPGVVPEGRRNDAMINQVDIFPTLLEYLGLGDRKIANSAGRSFAPMLRGKAMPWENEEIVFEYITTRVLQTRKWKYTKRFLAQPNELYDMESDPQETRNLIGDPAYSSVVADMDKRLTRFWEKYSDPIYDPWKGGTGKVLLGYYEADKRFREHFPGWREPFTAKVEPFRDPQ